jgi:hypothetical protein
MAYIYFFYAVFRKKGLTFTFFMRFFVKRAFTFLQTEKKEVFFAMGRVYKGHTNRSYIHKKRVHKVSAVYFCAVCQCSHLKKRFSSMKVASVPKLHLKQMYPSVDLMQTNMCKLKGQALKRKLKKSSKVTKETSNTAPTFSVKIK